MVRFEAEQSIELWVTDQPVAIQHYLRQPQRLVAALVEAHQVESLKTDLFRLKMRPMSFMMLQIQPVVDLRVWNDSGDCVFLKSEGCQIPGSDYIGQRFHLKLEGFLQPKIHGHRTLLQGTAHLQVDVELPPALCLTPKILVDAAGSSLLKGVLQTMKQRLRWRLVSDYQKWCATVLSDSKISSEAGSPSMMRSEL